MTKAFNDLAKKHPDDVIVCDVPPGTERRMMDRIYNDLMQGSVELDPKTLKPKKQKKSQIPSTKKKMALPKLPGRTLTDKDMQRINDLRASFILCFDNPTLEFEVLNEKRKAEVVKQHKTLDAYAQSKGWKDYRILRVNKTHMDLCEFLRANMEVIIGEDYDY
jgi:hypothetical protein